MAKYINADKLREKIYAEDTVSLAHGSSPEFDQGCHYAFLTVLSFLDSLQQEQPFLPSNLDEAVEKEFNNIWDSDLSGQCDTIVAKKVARYFYRLGISHNLQLPSSFEEARDKANFEEPHSLNAYIAFEEAFKAGAEWMAGQGEPQEHFVIASIADSPCGPAVVCYTEDFEVGDEVIVQIRKKQ